MHLRTTSLGRCCHFTIFCQVNIPDPLCPLSLQHHCRMCGKIFCHNCSNNFVMTPRSSRKERVCGSCLMNSSSLQGLPVSSKDSDDISSERSVSMTESFEESIQLPVKKSLKWNQPPAEDEPTPPSSHSISPVGSPPGESTVSGEVVR